MIMNIRSTVWTQNKWRLVALESLIKGLKGGTVEGGLGEGTAELSG